MTIIINVLGNDCMYSDTVDSVTAENVMYMCGRFAGAHYIMPEKIIIVNNTKVIEIDLESVLQSELDKQLQEE